MYGLTKAQIVDALLAAKRRGVDVALKTDKIENAGKAQAAVIAKLQAAGVPVEISEQARLPYCYGPRPVFAAEALIPSSSQTPVRATDKDGTPV
jgi:phosphatidylserine/phosphatidylglycerophosphate/cardiolipin synthase-like enzyme